MPSGRTHDRITLWSLPVVAGLTFSQTQSSNLTLLVSGGFLFGGLMFGPDLDIYSRQYQRWGWLRWIWLPYRKGLRHRSFWSHGPVVGTTLRLLYLSVWVAAVGLLGLAIARLLWQVQLDWQATSRWVWRSLLQYSPELMALYLGLELGAMSHSLSDWLGSAYKRRKNPRKRKTRQSSAQSQSQPQSQPRLPSESPHTPRSPKSKTPELPVLPPLPGSINAQSGIDPMNRDFRN